MSTFISIKDFRQHLARIANEVVQGKSFTVFRRSKPAFVVKPYEEGEENDHEAVWQTAVDFTNDGKKSGIPASTLLSEMQKFEKRYGSA